LKNLRKRFDRFCYLNRDKGIPNLMLYISIGSGVVYLMTQMAGNSVLYQLLCFDRALILRGQVWRLFSYALTYNAGNLLYTFIGLLCYFSLGRAIELQWGTLRFNLFYLSGLLMMDIFCLVVPLNASVGALNMSLLLAYATLYPNARFLLFFIIPVRAWIFALVDLVITAVNVISLSVPVFLFPYNLYPLLPVINYLLFFGKDVRNVIPVTVRHKVARFFGKKAAPVKAKVIPFPSGGSQKAAPVQNFTHRCSVCGRTDVTHPDLEFRYCSRCSGYHCYCQEHISNHTHIE